MADYKEQTLSGNSWQRCLRIVIDNSYGKNPSIAFDEEQIANIGDSQIHVGVGNIQIPFDPAAEFDIYDPETLEPTGQKASHAQMYGLLFSAYMDTAKKRDAAREAAAQPGPTATTPTP